MGAVDAGMIGAFLLFGVPEGEVFAAVLTYRVIAFWLPIPPGLVAFFQLRRTVARWEQEGRPAETDESNVPSPARESANTSQNEVTSERAARLRNSAQNELRAESES